MLSQQETNGKALPSGFDKGIPLAVDPNLINLVPRGSTPATETEDDNEQEEEKEEDEEGNIIAPSQSLVNNPYEMYEKMPLSRLIPLILRSRGPGFKFADLSEDALMMEINGDNDDRFDQKDANGDQDQDMDPNPIEEISMSREVSVHPMQVENSSPTDDCETMSPEQFLQIKRDVVQSINMALNESSLSLEFVSLLLSSVRPAAATASMSPYLKKTIPPASLNVDKVPLKRPTRNKILTSSVSHKGWKLRSLEESRTLLKETHNSLEKTLEKEHSYWSKICLYISNNDVVFKMKDKDTGERSLGIKYGYEDSGSTYNQDRGIAVIRHNSSLNKLELVSLEKSQSAIHINKRNNEKFLRVRIFTKIEEEDDYILTGESSLDSMLTVAGGSAQDIDIRYQIAKFQFFIFEQELMYRLKRESENLISYGVSIENENKITVEFPAEKVEIEMLQLDDDIIMNHQQDAPKTNDRKARLILTMLRLLLVVMYKKQLKQRLLLPQSTKHSNSKHLKAKNASSDANDTEILLLRPVMGKIRHQSYLNLLKKLIKDFVLEVVKDSKLSEFASNEKLDKEHAEEDCDSHIVKLDREITMFDGILKMPRSELLVELVGKGKLKLALQSTNYCNAVIKVKYINNSDEVLFDTKFSDFKELEEFLHFIINEYVI